jgi:hypothetical protein
MMTAPYQITADKDDIVIRFPRRLVDEVELARLLDYMEMESIRRRSELSSSEASVLAKSVKQGAWQQVRTLFTE